MNYTDNTNKDIKDSDMNNTSINDMASHLKNMATALPMMALDDIPTPASNASTITGLVKHSGTITGYQLSDGQIVSKEEGVDMARHGLIRGVGIAHKKDTEYLKSLPDSSEDNNLGSLPTVSHESFN